MYIYIYTSVCVYIHVYIYIPAGRGCHPDVMGSWDLFFRVSYVIFFRVTTVFIRSSQGL